MRGFHVFQVSYEFGLFLFLFSGALYGLIGGGLVLDEEFEDSFPGDLLGRYLHVGASAAGGVLMCLAFYVVQPFDGFIVHFMPGCIGGGVGCCACSSLYETYLGCK